MEPRLLLLTPLLVAAIVATALSLHSQHYLAHQVQQVATPQTSSLHQVQAAASPAVKPSSGIMEDERGLEDVSKALERAVKNSNTRGVGVEELNKLLSSGREQDRHEVAAHLHACELRHGAWYGNNTHVCWRSVCTLITSEHRLVFLLVAEQLRSSVELLESLNESLARGCLVMPGYAGKALAVAARIEELAEGNITGCSYVEMISILDDFERYVESMEPLWEKMSLGCARRKHLDTGWIVDMIRDTKFSLEKTAKKLRDLEQRINQSMRGLESLLEQHRQRVERQIYMINSSIGEESKKLEEWLENWENTVKRDIKAYINNVSRLYNTTPSLGTLDGLRNLQEDLERLQEEIGRLGQQLQLNITLPGERG